MLQIRSKLDQSAVVWHSSLTSKNRYDLKRIQKSGNGYKSYEEALEQLGLETLEKRRDLMCLKFSKQCLKLDKMRGLFPRRKSEHLMEKRSSAVYDSVISHTERFRRSTIPSMIRKLNDCQLEMKKLLKKLISFVPVNHDSSSPYHCGNEKL